METHKVQGLQSLPMGTQLLPNHSCCFLAQCNDMQQQHLQDKRVKGKDGQRIKFQKSVGGRGEKRDSEVGTFERTEADFLFQFAGMEDKLRGVMEKAPGEPTSTSTIWVKIARAGGVAPPPH